jgi:FkbM family methyltransferase
VVTGEVLGMLARLLDDPIVVVDVGCRWGFADVWADFGDRCIAIGFDPDVEECARLEQRYEGRAEVRVVPVGLGAHDGEATLYVTEERAGTSLYPSAPDAFERHPTVAAGRVEYTTTVEVQRLDDWTAAEDIGPVDVIKLDTQGSELDVLQGASRVLEGVRAIEVEVEFNPLYDGQPLFGDVDRFLREHGFVLWGLKHLSHYAQAGTFTDWRLREHHWFDRYAADVWIGAGQLFWADAFYVRREIAYPAKPQPWQELVRDACVTAALQIPDLADRLMADAIDTASEAAATVLANARASARDALVSSESDPAAQFDALMAERRVTLAQTSRPLTEEMAIDVGSPLFRGSGWQHLQRTEHGWVRWTGPSREATIELPLVLVPEVRIELLVVAAMSARIIEELEAEVNRVPLPLTMTSHEYGTLVSGVVPRGYASPRRYTRLVLRTCETMLWSDAHPELESDDEMGLAVAWVRLTPHQR